MKPKHRRLIILCVAGIMLCTSAGLVLLALQDNLIFFRTPSQLQTQPIAMGENFRLGGLVKQDSVQSNGTNHQFTITDQQHEIVVTYTGLLPNLFRENQGIVVYGKLNPDGIFIARDVLAKHDENYMPAELVDELKKNGEWRPQ